MIWLLHVAIEDDSRSETEPDELVSVALDRKQIQIPYTPNLLACIHALHGETLVAKTGGTAGWEASIRCSA